MSEREWRFYLDDMMGFVEKAMAYSQDFDQAKFESSGLSYDATVRSLELIGEAAGHIPESIRSAHPVIPWRQVIATRNRLIHGYLGAHHSVNGDVAKIAPAHSVGAISAQSVDGCFR